MIGNSDFLQRVHASLAATAWVSWKFGDAGDADDYVQTMIVARSLLKSGGFDHRDVVDRYRRVPNYRLRGRNLQAGGVSSNYRGQISKLIQSEDPCFFATDGVSDGSAMKVAPLAAAYAENFSDLVATTDQFTRVTHASVESRLAALLVALRLRQSFLGKQHECIRELIDEIQDASDQLKFGDKSAFFLKRVKVAGEIASRGLSAPEMLEEMAREVGIEHLAWSTPIAAAFWSFHDDPKYRKWMPRKGEETLVLPRNFGCPVRKIQGDALRESVHLENIEHLKKLGQLEEFENSPGHHWRSGLDIDTFFSIAISILASRHGVGPIRFGLRRASRVFGDDLWEVSVGLAEIGNLNPPSSRGS